MRFMQMAKNAILAVVFGLAAAGSANAAIDATFDAAASNIGAGTYAFQLSGVPSTPTSGSVFELLNFTTIGNAQTIVEDSAPSGWSPSSTTTGVAEWDFSNLSGNYNGIFVITAKAGLSGTITTGFDYLDSGHDENVSGSLTIAAVPEPAECGLFFGIMGLAVSTISGWRCRRSNISLA